MMTKSNLSEPLQQDLSLLQDLSEESAATIQGGSGGLLGGVFDFLFGAPAKPQPAPQPPKPPTSSIPDINFPYFSSTNGLLQFPTGSVKL
jgi:hypothetical protein